MSFFEKLVLIDRKENLEEFMNDSNCHIRMHVARKGYGLDKLINDEYEIVREAVINYCRKHLDIDNCKKIITLYSI